MKPYPTYDEYVCDVHPEAGWISDRGNPSPWELHRRASPHPPRQMVKWRSLPLTPEMEADTQLLGYPPNVHELLVAARRR